MSKLNCDEWDLATTQSTLRAVGGGAGGRGAEGGVGGAGGAGAEGGAGGVPNDLAKV